MTKQVRVSYRNILQVNFLGGRKTKNKIKFELYVGERRGRAQAPEDLRHSEGDEAPDDNDNDDDDYHHHHDHHHSDHDQIDEAAHGDNDIHRALLRHQHKADDQDHQIPG